MADNTYNTTGCSISQNPEKIKWLDSTGKINEPAFCQYFTSNRDLLYANGKYYCVDGEIDSQMLRRDIAYILADHCITSDIAKKVNRLINAIQLFNGGSAPIPKDDEIHVNNGILYVDGTFTSEKRICINRLNVTYDPTIFKQRTEPEQFLAFLDDLLIPDDILTLQEYLGYCMIPSTKGQTALFLIGNGGEGKSRIGVILNDIFGRSMLSMKLDKIESDRFSRYNLINKLLMNDDEMTMQSLQSTSYIKNIITSEIPIDVEAKCVQSQQHQIYCRFLCFGNGSPRALYDRSDGFVRRLLILKTKAKPANRSDDPDLIKKLLGEKNQIFYWMFAGLQRLISNNYKFTISQRTKENLTKAASDNCNIVDFINEALMIKSNASIASVDLYDAYLQWCVDNALDEIKREAFIRWLIAYQDKYNIKYTNNISSDGKRVRGFTGISIKNDKKMI